ncbi:unnamed protein product [Ixodes hexagonus]
MCNDVCVQIWHMCLRLLSPLGVPSPALDQPLSFPAWTRRDTPSLPFGCLPPKLSSVALTSDMHMFCEHPQERKGTNLDNNSSGKATKRACKKNAEKQHAPPADALHVKRGARETRKEKLAKKFATSARFFLLPRSSAELYW